MARLPRLKEFAKEHDLKIISIFDMCYESLLDGVEHIAMVKGEIGDGEDVLVRIHSECLANDIFGSNVCDCGGQLDDAMKQIEDARRGVLVYLRGSNGKHIDLGVKLPSFVTDSNIDANDYDIAAKVRVSSAGLEVSNE
ncbi:Bifunctional riboflavin biosynthesis protein RIBA 1, chloroplastic [Linum perenne]